MPGSQPRGMTLIELMVAVTVGALTCSMRMSTAGASPRRVQAAGSSSKCVITTGSLPSARGDG